MNQDKTIMISSSTNGNQRGTGAGHQGMLLTVTIAGVAKEDAGAASGLVNAAHQLGGSLGLAILVVVFASVHPPLVDPHVELAHRISAAMGAASVLLAMAWVVVMFLVARPNPAQAAPAWVASK